MDRLYQLKRNCNACQENDIRLLEGELVALLEDKDPMGSSSRWLVNTGCKSVYVCANAFTFVFLEEKYIIMYKSGKYYEILVVIN